MQHLSRNEFLEVLGLSGPAFDQLQHAGHVALAFETPMPSTPGRYLDLDLVAMGMNLGLAPSVGRENSTAIVLCYFHQWAHAVGHAEADPSQDFFMAVGGVGWDNAKKSTKLLLVTNGTLDQITGDLRTATDLVGYYTINISSIIRRLREKAAAVGIDLTRPFFFPPDDPRFKEILTRVKRERDARFARLRGDKKKFAAVKARARRQDIFAAPRVQDIHYQYQLAVQETHEPPSSGILSRGFES
jgi:hypothetical protein